MDPQPLLLPILNRRDAESKTAATFEAATNPSRGTSGGLILPVPKRGQSGESRRPEVAPSDDLGNSRLSPSNSQNFVAVNIAPSPSSDTSKTHVALSVASTPTNAVQETEADFLSAKSQHVNGYITIQDDGCEGPGSDSEGRGVRNLWIGAPHCEHKFKEYGQIQVWAPRSVHPAMRSTAPHPQPQGPPAPRARRTFGSAWWARAPSIADSGS
ncbi:unnamed protein product [Durusdinium trenchii]|uniref:Uncharacterized protein n=1 Tax=Durusdinium trenchii TaxID=1381693 RepID=A0ABP0PTQ1_9DINO